MAYYAALISLLQTLEQIPKPLLQQITTLQEKVNHLVLILEEKGRSTIIKDLESRIRYASYEAQDIIESHVSGHALLESFSRCFERFEEYTCLMINSRSLEKIVVEFDSILEHLSRIKDGEVEVDSSFVASSTSSRTFVSSNKSSLVGLDEDSIQIKDWLTGSSSRVGVMSVAGMGGICKTTLVRNLYSDLLIEHHFDIRVWIVVAQENNVLGILRSVLHSIGYASGELIHQKISGEKLGELVHKIFSGESIHQKTSSEKLGDFVHKILKGRRYLIVMDDIWDTKTWDGVKRFFPDDNNGSRIILTSRLLEVAVYVGSNYIHHMSFLSPEVSWSLLHEKVFGKECCPFELEEIGKKFAENCKGLPLAITVIGGILSKGSRTRDYWKYIAENVKSAIITGNDDHFIEILSLSYNFLPHHLKPCFLYMGVFPEDYVIHVSHLIRLWIAEGFIQPLASKGLEEVAKDYLNDLNDRSLILVDKRNHIGGIKSCLIHDLLRELCVKKAQDEIFHQIMNSHVDVFPQGRNNQRRVSIHTDHLTNVHDSSVRSLIYICKCLSNNQLLSFTMSSKLLRILDAHTVIFYEFPYEILELAHLRFLAFIYRGKNDFPASISKLQNLQTLIVYRGSSTSYFRLGIIYLPFVNIYGGEILRLPSTIWEMPKLRHLLFEKSFLPAPVLGKDSVVLDNLQTLSGVINFRCTREVIEIMTNLKKLGISYFYDTDTEWSSYELNNLVHLHQLETLKCHFSTNNFQAWKPLPLNLAFPPNLKKLTLSGCRIPWNEMTLVGSLPNLQVLKLKDHAFEGPLWEPHEGEFSELKFLLICDSNLEHWRANDTHFPHLQHLNLSYCTNLVEIPSEIGEIPTLEMPELYECNPSAVTSAVLIQEEQQSLENISLRVRVISSEEEFLKSQHNTSLRKVHRASSDWF